MCTPWDKTSANKLNEYGMRFFKVASADFTNLDLLEHLAAFNKPLILSTGMTEGSEIDEVTVFLNNLGVEYALLHCNSAYQLPSRILICVSLKDLKIKRLSLVIQVMNWELTLHLLPSVWARKL